GAKTRHSMKVTRGDPGWLVSGRLASFPIDVTGGDQVRGELTVVDRLPADFEPRQLPFHLGLPAPTTATLMRPVMPRRRGRFALLSPSASVAAPLGVAWQRVASSTVEHLRVLPDLRALRRFDSLVRQRRLNEMGIVRARIRGEGSEIAGLRAYAPGDSFS